MYTEEKWICGLEGLQVPVEELTNPALLAGTRIGLDHVWWVHTNIETETKSHTPGFHLRSEEERE